jgi:hypothetical protein
VALLAAKQLPATKHDAEQVQRAIYTTFDACTTSVAAGAGCNCNHTNMGRHSHSHPSPCAESAHPAYILLSRMARLATAACLLAAGK